jgi:hypothetical protein
MEIQSAAMLKSSRNILYDLFDLFKISQMNSLQRYNYLHLNIWLFKKIKKLSQVGFKEPAPG